jgi:arylsulfatase
MISPRILFITGILLAAFYPAVAECGTGAAERPNIILMMADDLGWGDPRCFNPDSPIHTPHLDAMAAAGMKFNRFYAAAPVCSPTRGSCLTGRHPFRYGVYSANAGHMRQGEQTLAELLKEYGYRTAHFGKWHLGTLTKTVRDSNRGGQKHPEEYAPPQDHGFEVCFSTEAKVPTWDPMWKPAEDAARKEWDYIEDLGTAVQYGTRYWNEKGEVVKENLEGDDSRVIMDRAIPFIERASRDRKPFFTVIWFHAPHLPVVAGPKHAAIYSAYESFHKNYYGSVTAMDEQIGRLRAVLKKARVADNTMVWFCSDNGPEGSAKNSPGSAAHFRGRKRSLYEGGIRVPGVLEWPARVEAGSETDFPSVTSDYLPTIIDALGAKIVDGRPIDGISLLPLLDGKMTERQKPIGFCSKQQRALVARQYKLYSHDEGATWELYDLLDDPVEKKDLAAKIPEKVAAMEQVLKQWQLSCARSDGGSDY